MQGSKVFLLLKHQTQNQRKPCPLRFHKNTDMNGDNLGEDLHSGRPFLPLQGRVLVGSTSREQTHFLGNVSFTYDCCVYGGGTSDHPHAIMYMCV